MTYDLSPGVWLAWVGPDLVALTLSDGQYLCLPDLAAQVAARPDGLVEVPDREIAGELVAAGLLGPAQAAHGAAAAPITPARRDLSLAPAHRTGRGAAAGLGRAWLAMVRHYYGRPLRRLVAEARRARPPSPRTDDQGLARRVADFEALLPWAPLQGECLFRSFMLLNFLRADGYDATWVFGVRTWPFQAHCWLQAGEVVLDDVLDRVKPFTPILAV
jgi:hypothetical protein